MSNILQLPDTEIEYYKNIIKKSRMKKKAVPIEIKKKVYDLMRSSNNPYALIKSLSVTKRTITRWNNEFERTKAIEGIPTSENIDSIKVCPKQKYITINRKLFSPKNGFLIVSFLITESFLLSQNIQFFQGMNIPTSEVIVRAVIAEICPIIISWLIGHQLKLRHKAILYIGLILSFVFSIYCSSASKLNRVQGEASKVFLLRKQEKTLVSAIIEKKERISFYEKQLQSNGTIGWPQTVRKLETEKSKLFKKLNNIQNRLEKTTNTETLYTNLIFDFIFKLIAQLLVISIVMSRFTIPSQK